MALHITGDTMILKIGGRVVATARFSQHAAADGDGAWIVSCAELARRPGGYGFRAGGLGGAGPDYP